MLLIVNVYVNSYLILGLRKQVVNSVYRMCATVSTNYIKTHPSDWQLGGPNVIVIIDVYPEGCKKFDPEHYVTKNTVPILCIAEAKVIKSIFKFIYLCNWEAK